MQFLNISKKTLKNFSYLSIAHVIVMLIGLISSVIWTRYTSIEIYGKYQLLISFISIVGVLSIPGFNMSAQLSSAQMKHGNLKLLFKRKVLWSYLSSMVLLFIALYYQFFKDDAQMAYMLYIASFIYPFYNLHSIWESWLTAISEYKKLSLIQILFALIGLISLVISLILIENIYFVIIITFSSIALSNIFIIKYFQKRAMNDTEDYELLNYGYKLSFAMLMPGILSFDKLIISEYLSVEDVAIYSIAMVFPMYIKVLYGMINRLITPHISSAKDTKAAWKYFKPKFVIIIIFFSLLGLIGFFSIDSIITIIYTDKYQESGLYAKWLWLFITLGVPPTYLANILRSQQKLKFSYYFEAFNSLGKIGLFLILIPMYKLWGAVCSIVFMNVLSSIFFISYFNYELKKELDVKKNIK